MKRVDQMKRGYSLAYGACLMLAAGASSAEAQDLSEVCAKDPRQFAEMFYTAKFSAKTVLELRELHNGLSGTCLNSMRPGYALARYIDKTSQEDVIDLAQQMYRFTLNETIRKYGFPKGAKVCAMAQNQAMFQEMPLEDLLALQTFGTDVTRVTYKAIGWFSSTAKIRIERSRSRDTDLEEIQLKEGKHSNGQFYTKAAEGSAETCLVATQLGFVSGKRQDLAFPQEGLSYVFMQTESFGLQNAARRAAYSKPLADYIPGWPSDGPWSAKLKELQKLGLLP